MLAVGLILVLGMVVAVAYLIWEMRVSQITDTFRQVVGGPVYKIQRVLERIVWRKLIPSPEYGYVVSLLPVQLGRFGTFRMVFSGEKFSSLGRVHQKINAIFPTSQIEYMIGGLKGYRFGIDDNKVFKLVDLNGHTVAASNVRVGEVLDEHAVAFFKTFVGLNAVSPSNQLLIPMK